MNHLSPELLNLYLDEALETTERSRVELHLRECRACQQEMEALQAFFGSLNEWQLEPPPYDISQAVMAKLEPAPATQKRWVGRAVLVAQVIVSSLLGWWVVPWLVNSLNSNPLTVDFSLAGELFSRLVDWFAGLPGIIPDLGNINFPVAPLDINPFGWLAIAVGLGIVWLVGNRLLLTGLNQSNNNSQEVSR